MNPSERTLIAFFKLCSIHLQEHYITTTYHHIARGINQVRIGREEKEGLQSKAIQIFYITFGRAYTVHPNHQECFCLRMLLHEVQGSASFEGLRSVDGIVYTNYREVCDKRGMLEDDSEM